MFERLQSEFQPVLERFLASPAMRHVAAGLLTIDEYKSFLTQVYFYAREDPQLQALATVYFRGRQRARDHHDDRRLSLTQPDELSFDWLPRVPEVS